MFHFFPNAINHKHKNVGENKHFVYNTLLIKKVTEILILQLFRQVMFYVFAKSVLQVKIFGYTFEAYITIM